MQSFQMLFNPQLLLPGIVFASIILKESQGMKGWKNMVIERIVRIVAGSMITGSVILSQLHSSYWLVLTLFVGSNLFQSGITKWCLLEDILKYFGFRSCCVTANVSHESEVNVI